MLLPCLAAAPLVAGGGGTASAALYASLAATAGLLRGALVLPDALARDVGLTLLGFHVLLQIWAGLATRRLLVRIGLDGAAAAGALTFVLSPPFLPGGAGSGSAALGVSLVLLLLAVERCLAPRYPGEGGALSLAAMIVALGMFGDPVPLEAGGVLALFWATGRLAASPPGTRGRAMWRLAAGAVGGLLVAVPLNAALNSVAGTVGLADPEDVARSLGAWLGLLHPPAWSLELLAQAAAPTLPLLAAAALGAMRGAGAGASGGSMRAALAAAALVAGGLMTWRAPAIGADAAPVLFLAAAALAAVATRDAGKGVQASSPVRASVGLATAAVAAAVARHAAPATRWLTLGEFACAIVVLACAGRPRIAMLAVLLGVAGGYETRLLASVLPL